MNDKGEGTVIQEVDVIKLIREVGRRSKVSQAKILQKIEPLVTDPQEYAEIRKFILDEINGLTRSYVNLTFGDIEFLIK